MGNFLAATALRGSSVQEIVVAITTWFEDRFIVCAAADDRVRRSAMDHLTVYEPVNDWTTVVWPMFFGHRHVEMAQHLSARLQVVVCSADIYHSETWQHLVYDDGELVDAYGTDPSYLVSSLDDPRAVARMWKGDPEAVTRHVGGSTRDVARVYRRNRRRWTFDEWAFVHLWEGFGIVYPVGKIPPAASIVLPEQWDKLLPTH